MNRLVVINSGLPYASKSWQLKVMLALPEFAQAQTIRMDDVRVQLFGHRADLDVTKHEHLFKNEKTRFLILERLVCGCPLVISEALLLTEAGQQRPLLETVSRAEMYVQTIERELAGRETISTPNPPSQVLLRVILFHANLETTNRRIAANSDERRSSNAAVFDLEGLRGAVIGFEYPRLYRPLISDTSDESEENQIRQTGEIKAFVFTGTLPNDHEQRWAKMVSNHHELRKALGIS